MIHVVGLDLSLARTGWAVVRPGEQIRHGVIATDSVNADDYYPETLDRIRRIAARILERTLADARAGDVIVIGIEGPSYGSKGGQEHARGGLWWLMNHLISKKGTVVIVPPKSAKSYATSNGNADKVAMVAAVARAYPDLYITDDNEADAVVIASMISRELGFPQEVSTQRVRPAALDGVKWPASITRRRAQ